MLKQVLLNTGYFVDNSYLDEYLELVQKPFSFSGYSERHHVIPAVIYSIKHSIKDNREARKLANADLNNFLVDLLFKDHCKAHWLLYNCTLNEVKACNARAYILMTGRKVVHLEELSTDEYNEIQLYRDQVMEEDDYYWSLEEKQLLAKHYATASFEELTNIFGRNKEAIIAAANLMGLTRRLWSKEEEQWLINNYAKYSRKECADLLNKSEASINKKCITLGLYKPSNIWTEEQNTWLLENYTKHTVSEAASILGRSYNAVRSQAVKLGLKNPLPETNIKEKRVKTASARERFKWTPEAEQWLIQNFVNLGQRGCAQHLGITESAANHKYIRLKKA